MTFVNKTYLQLTLYQEDKDFIKSKADEMGYRTVSAFLLSAAKNQIKVEMDMSPDRELTREINYIGKNINSLVRRINSEGFYSDTDIDYLVTNQKKLISKMNREYKKLLNFKQNFNVENMSLSDKKNLAKQLQQHEIPVSKRFWLEKVYDGIRDDILYVVEIISKSPAKDEGLDQYLLNYLNGETLFGLSEQELVELSDAVFDYVQKLKFKMVNLENEFDDDDWFALKDILDEYEIY